MGAKSRSLVLQIFTTAAAAAAITAIACAIVLFNDINNFQQEVRLDLEQFKVYFLCCFIGLNLIQVYADDAWNEMVHVSNVHGRQRRQYVTPPSGGSYNQGATGTGGNGGQSGAGANGAQGNQGTGGAAARTGVGSNGGPSTESGPTGAQGGNGGHSGTGPQGSTGTSSAGNSPFVSSLGGAAGHGAQAAAGGQCNCGKP